LETSPKAYGVWLTKPAKKDRDDLRGWEDRINDELLVLENAPYQGHSLKGSLQGIRSLEFSLAGTAYRAAYVVLEEKREIVVIMIGAHEGFYQKAQRRAEGLKRSGTI